MAISCGLTIMENEKTSSGSANNNVESRVDSRVSAAVKRDSLMGDGLLNFDPSELEDDDWKDVFDEENALDIDTSPDNNNDEDDDDDEDNNYDDNEKAKAQREGLDPSVLMPPPADKKPFSLDGNNGIKSSSNKNLEFHLIRQLRAIENADNGLPPPSWRSEAADLPHRQKMIQQVAQLLFARKKDKPSDQWMERLPVKAKMLETQLYKSAPSLESYLEQKTLKKRLGKLASAITSHYKCALQEKRRSSSAISVSSIMSGSSLGSLGERFSDASLRRLSQEGIPSSTNKPGLRREQSESAVMSSSTAQQNNFMRNSLQRQQSDSVVSQSNSSSTPPMGPVTPGAGNSAAAMKGNIDSTTSNAPAASGNANSTNPNQLQQQSQLQQQLLANMRQQQNIRQRQQEIMARQMGNGQGAMTMTPQQMAMMAAGNNVMMNQFAAQQQQQQMNMMSQQNAGMQNMAMLQQQQQMLMNNGMNVGNNGMNMMMVPNVIPGGGGGDFPSNFNGTNNPNNNNMMARDNNAMPPPTALNAGAPSGVGPRGQNPGIDGNSLAPGSFHW